MSLFKRPAWAKTQISVEDETEENIFSHASRSYSDIVAEDQRRKQERAEKQRLKQERREERKIRRSFSKRERAEEGDEVVEKKRRISLEDEDDDVLAKDTFSPAHEIRYDEEDDGGLFGDSAPRRQSPRFARSLNKPSKLPESPLRKSRATVIDLGGSEDDVEVQEVYATKVRPEEPMDDESDDEFAELARQARAKRRDNEKKQTPDLHTPVPGQETSEAHPPSYPTPPAPDPPVKLFISSRLPDTNSLIVYRKISQRLQEIREVWCKKQGFTEQQSQQVFFIHRMRRLYDVTTCRSLGLDVDAGGNIIMQGADGIDGVDQVHLEAVTAEIFAAMKEERLREGRKKKDLLVPEDEEADAQAGANETQQATQSAKDEPLIRILLKAKGQHEPYKLKVKPTTTFAKIMTACSGHFQVNETQSVFLEFDGERLDPSQQVSDTEISDMDCIDVHIA